MAEEKGFSELPRVYLVGAGPGHPGLITRRGLSLLRAADVVVCDALVNPQLLLELRKDAVVERADRGKGLGTAQRLAAISTMVEHAKKGKKVVRLKGGDPFLFGRVLEEVEALEEAGLAFEIVPGVSSAFSVPGLAGIPLTERTMASSVVLATGSPAPGRAPVDFAAFGERGDTLVVFMGLGKVGAITQQLIESGRSPDTPAAAISLGTLAEQKTVVGDLGNLAERLEQKPLPTPGILVFGEVVGFRERLAVFERRPLFGLKVVVTRAREQSSEFVQGLSELGAKPILFPTIALSAIKPDSKGVEALESAGKYDGIFFTSVNSVRRWFEELGKLGLDARVMAGAQVIAVGKSTAKALRECGVIADLTPTVFSQAGIVESLGEEGILGRRFLYPRALHVAETLNKAVLALGGNVESLVLYETVTRRIKGEEAPLELEQGDFHVVTFTSPSSVRGFEDLMGREGALALLKEKSVLAIGATTAGQLRAMGVRDVSTPEKSTINHMLQFLASRHQKGAERVGEGFDED